MPLFSLKKNLISFLSINYIIIRFRLKAQKELKVLDINFSSNNLLKSF